jgi:hypothetical protein
MLEHKVVQRNTIKKMVESPNHYIRYMQRHKTKEKGKDKHVILVIKMVVSQPITYSISGKKNLSIRYAKLVQ